jgi:lipopolysaccharide export system protein LptC
VAQEPDNNAEPDADYARQRWPSQPAARFDSSYSRFVGIAKFVLLVVAAGLITLVVIWPQFEEKKEAFRLGVTSIITSEADDQNMLNARFRGTDNRNQPFVVTAVTALQSPDNDNLVNLDLPKADITLQNESWIALTANTGTYHKVTRMLDLKDNVILFHDLGYEFHTASARIDISNRVARGDSPVKGQGPFGQIEARGFRILESGERIIFTGKSRLVIYPENSGKKQGKDK